MTGVQTCALPILTSEHSGFYMICKGDVDNPRPEDELLAQTWAWRGQNGALVFDSVELSSNKAYRNNEMAVMVMKMFNYLAFKLVQEPSIPEVMVGKESGISSFFGKETNESNGKFIDYDDYCDSEKQKEIVGKGWGLGLLLGEVGKKNEVIEKVFRKWLSDELKKAIPLKENENIIQLIAVLLANNNKKMEILYKSKDEIILDEAIISPIKKVKV